MKKMWKSVVAAALMVAMASLVSSTNADDKEKAKFESIGACMKCQNASRGKIEKAAKAGKWEDANATAKTWHAAAESLAALKPKKGSEDSWKELTGKYTSTVKAIVEGTEKKDAEAVSKKLGEFGKSCKGCHDSHK